jgi:aromatic-L-amino-acid decarboxylase
MAQERAEPSLASSIEISTDQWRDFLEKAVARLALFLEELPQSPATRLEGAWEKAGTFDEPLPQGGADFSHLLDRIMDDAVPFALNPAHPGYLAYVPGGGLLHASVGDLIAAVTNRFVGAQFAAPVMAQIEATVVGWFCQLIGFPDAAAGILTTGGSLANLTAVTVARGRLGEDFLDGVAYLSTQAHHSMEKALRLAGIPARGIRLVAVDERGRIRLDALQEAIDTDRAQKKRPFLVVGNAGTTNTGAVDDLIGLARVAGEEDLHFHIDGAYGGFFAMTERGKQSLVGLERADSVTLDPHKGLFLPYGTGCLLVRKAELLLQAHGAQADYLPGEVDGADPRSDFMRLSPELSRGNRSLRLWIPLMMHGVPSFVAALDEKLDLARWAADRLRAHPGIVFFDEPRLSLFAFRLKKDGLSEDEEDALTLRWLEQANAPRRAHFTHTRVAGRVWARICVLSFRTHQAHLEVAVSDLLQAADEVLG